MKKKKQISQQISQQATDTTKTPSLRLTTNQGISQVHLQKTTNSFLTNSIAHGESGTREGHTPNYDLKSKCQLH